MKQLTVLNVAFPFAPVKEDTVGGAEQVLLALDDAIISHKYNSIVVASENSEIKGELFACSLIYDKIIDKNIREKTYKIYRKIILDILQIRNVDLIHFHGIDYDQYIPSVNIPVLVTLHLPPSWYNPCALFTYHKNIFYNCVSAYQNSLCPNINGLLGIVENGVPIPSEYVKYKKYDYTVSMGRICPEKGYHIAFDAARRVNIPHLHAGTVFNYEEHVSYFNDQILPRCDNLRYHFIGNVGGAKKAKLLGAAKCILIPSLVPETSSLVAFEAMAQGTPVIAFKTGALQEIVIDGYNGYLVNNEIEMADAIKKVSQIDSWNCYTYVKKMHSLDRMINQYFELYFKLIKHSEDSVDIKEIIHSNRQESI